MLPAHTVQYCTVWYSIDLWGIQSAFDLHTHSQWAMWAAHTVCAVFWFCILKNMQKQYSLHAHIQYNNSDKDLGEHNHLLWIALSSFPARICLLCWNMLLLYEYECGFCLCEHVLETAADRDCQGKRQTSVRMNAVCEFRCLIDPSGPQSLFSISIYHHLSSPRPHQCQPLLPYPLSFTFLLPGFHSLRGSTLIHPFAGFECPQKTTAVNDLPRPNKRVKAIKRYFSGFYYLVWQRRVGKNGKMPMYCLQTTSRCSCGSGESTTSCGSLVNRGPVLPVLSPLICVCVCVCMHQTQAGNYICIHCTACGSITLHVYKTQIYCLLAETV